MKTRKEELMNMLLEKVIFLSIPNSAIYHKKILYSKPYIYTNGQWIIRAKVVIDWSLQMVIYFLICREYLQQLP